MRPSDVAERRVHWTVAALGAALVVVTVGGLALVRGDDPGSMTIAVSCGDPAGDPQDVETGDTPATSVPGTDLQEVELRRDGGELKVAFLAHERIPTDAGSLGGDVELPVQWVVWLMDGADIAYHLRAILRADGWELLRDDLQREPVVTAEAPAVDGRLLTWSVPLEDLPQLPDEFGWVALTTYGTPSVQDVCPDSAAESLDPDFQLRFPDGD